MSCPVCYCLLFICVLLHIIIINKLNNINTSKTIHKFYYSKPFLFRTVLVRWNIKCNIYQLLTFQIPKILKSPPSLFFSFISYLQQLTPLLFRPSSSKPFVRVTHLAAVSIRSAPILIPNFYKSIQYLNNMSLKKTLILKLLRFW